MACWIIIILHHETRTEEKARAPKVSPIAGWKSLFNNLVAVGLLSWLPSVLAANFNMTSNSTSVILTINSIVMAIAIAGSGIVINKYFANRTKSFIISTSVNTMLVVFISSTNMVLTLAMLYLITLFSMAAFTGFLGLPYRCISMSIIGSSFAVINIGAFVGGFVSPLIIGNLVTASGGSFYSAYIAMAIGILISGLSILLLGKSEQQQV